MTDDHDRVEAATGTRSDRDAGGSGTATPASTRRAHIETGHGDQETAAILARALRPDNTDEMDTRVEGSRLVTTIDRETTGGLQSTVDDYVVNLQTGTQVLTSEGTDATRAGEQGGNHNTDSDGDTSSRDTSDADTSDTNDTNTTETDNE